MRWMMAVVCALAGAGAWAEGYDLKVGGQPWLHTVTTAHDAASDEMREQTYKVFTQVYDFDGEGFLTKGAGGKYTHHRGLFIGWKDTLVKGEDYDTWHMTNCYQEHVVWLHRRDWADAATQSQVIEWRTLAEEPFIREVRTIQARQVDSLRVIDFSSDLQALGADVELKGDLQHAGMQVRMADEVSEHEDSTAYTLPEGADEDEDDQVIGAWWALGNFEVGGRRVWVLHMTPSNHPTGEPVYSIRQYGRFGAFWEQTIPANEVAEFNFRIVVSAEELDRADCERLYAEYTTVSGERGASES